MLAIFAQNVVGPGWSIGSLAIAVIVIAAIIAVVFIAVRAFGLPIPQWVWQIIGVIIVAFVCIFAIRLLMSM